MTMDAIQRMIGGIMSNRELESVSLFLTGLDLVQNQ